MPPTPSDAWTRLGQLLVQRRIELAPRYRERTKFADEVGIKWRLLYDIERAKRDSFSAETLAAVEVAYQWQPGSVARILAGGDPVPIAAAPPASRNGNGPERPPDPDGYVRPVFTDPALEDLARELERRWPALWHRDVAALVHHAEAAWRSRSARPGDGEPAHPAAGA